MSVKREWNQARVLYPLITIVFIIVVIAGWIWCLQPVTTALVVRHAERSNDSLNQQGLARADKLAHVASDAGVVAIYATEYQRTQQTAQPLATLLGIPVTQYSALDVEGLVNQVLSNHAGEVVLIVGHSNTVPDIIVEFGGSPIDPLDEEEDFDNLFIVTVYRNGAAEVIHLNYGEPD